MPGLITHLLCGDTVLTGLVDSEPDSVAAVSENRRVFNMGTQGPDFLFYDAVFARHSGMNAKRIGNLLHDKKTGEFIAAMLRYIVGNPEASSHRMPLQAYVLGYICHYVLDLHAHPYIYCKSGFDRNDSECAPGTRYKHTFHHRILETWIDTLMLQRLRQKKPSDLDAANLLKITVNDARTIGRMYEWALYDVHSINCDSNKIADAFGHMAFIVSLLKDRSGMKRRLSARIEKLLNTYPAVSSMIHPDIDNFDDSFDYLNMRGKTWFLPWDRASERNETFPEIFAEAAAEALQLCRFTTRWIKDGRYDKDTVLKELGNRSMSSGLDCEDEKPFLYSDCIFESQKPPLP